MYLMSVTMSSEMYQMGYHIGFAEGSNTEALAIQAPAIVQQRTIRCHFRPLTSAIRAPNGKDG